ncbi:MAG: alpha/beta hydrolase [Sphingomonas sp.]|nr:alpha/beta hydrolase [Sphingomonas sp.]
MPPPSRLLFAAEVPRGAWALGTLLLRGTPRDGPPGDGRPVLLLPGLMIGDRALVPMQRYLRRLGYAADSWGLGRNRGVRTVGEDNERVHALIERRAAAEGPVTLVGVSLGGIMARLAAHRLGPAKVRQVITLASPYAAGPRATNVWRAYQWASGERIDDPRLVARLAELARPLPVPASAIWSRTDGLVSGHACHVPGEPGLRAIEIGGSHLGVHFRASVLRAVADELARG